MASVPLMLFATASQAAFDRSSTGRMTTWLRTPTRPFSRLYPWNVAFFRSRAMRSPAFGLDVVDMGMLAHLDRRHRAADIDAVLDHRFVRGQFADGELVADGDVALRAHPDFPVLVHDPAGQFLAGLDAFHDHDADRISFVVHDEMNHVLRSFPGYLQRRLPPFNSIGLVQSC